MLVLHLFSVLSSKTLFKSDKFLKVRSRRRRVGYISKICSQLKTMVPVAYRLFFHFFVWMLKRILLYIKNVMN